MHPASGLFQNNVLEVQMACVEKKMAKDGMQNLHA